MYGLSTPFSPCTESSSCYSLASPIYTDFKSVAWGKLNLAKSLDLNKTTNLSFSSSSNISSSSTSNIPYSSSNSSKFDDAFSNGTVNQFKYSPDSFSASGFSIDTLDNLQILSSQSTDDENKAVFHQDASF